MNANDISSSAVRWGKGIKLIAVGWFALFFHAWLKGEITSGLAFAAILTGTYWTLGSFLEASASMHGIRRHELHKG